MNSLLWKSVNTIMNLGQEINFLMEIALKKIAFLPFAYVIFLNVLSEWREVVFQDVNYYSNV